MADRIEARRKRRRRGGGGRVVADLEEAIGGKAVMAAITADQELEIIQVRPIAAAIGDPSTDPQLAPRPPHPGFFHTSFLENPWHDHEEKLGIPHIKAIPFAETQPQPTQKNHDEGGASAEQPSADSQENGATT